MGSALSIICSPFCTQSCCSLGLSSSILAFFGGWVQVGLGLLWLCPFHLGNSSAELLLSFPSWKSDRNCATPAQSFCELLLHWSSTHRALFPSLCLLLSLPGMS